MSDPLPQERFVYQHPVRCCIELDLMVIRGVGKGVGNWRNFDATNDRGEVRVDGIRLLPHCLLGKG